MNHAGSRAQLPSSWQLLQAAHEISFQEEPEQRCAKKKKHGFESWRLGADKAQLAAEDLLASKLIPDKINFTSTIEHTIVGMTENKLVNSAGMIGKFHVEATSASGGDISMAGQFGGGLNSACLVSDDVRVVSKSNDIEQFIREPAANRSFT